MMICWKLFGIHFFKRANLMLVTFVQSMASETVIKFVPPSLITDWILPLPTSLSRTCFSIAFLKISLTLLTTSVVGSPDSTVKGFLQWGHVFFCVFAMHPVQYECPHGRMAALVTGLGWKQTAHISFALYTAFILANCASMSGVRSTVISWPVLFLFRTYCC